MYDKNSSEDNVDLDWTKEKEVDETVPLFWHILNQTYIKYSCFLPCNIFPFIQLEYQILYYRKKITEFDLNITYVGRR